MERHTTFHMAGASFPVTLTMPAPTDITGQVQPTVVAVHTASASILRALARPAATIATTACLSAASSSAPSPSTLASSAPPYSSLLTSLYFLSSSFLLLLSSLPLPPTNLTIYTYFAYFARKRLRKTLALRKVCYNRIG